MTCSSIFGNFILVFAAQFLALGLWSYIIGLDKGKIPEAAPPKAEKQGRVICREIVPRVEGDDFCTLEIREYGLKDCRLSVVYDGACLFELGNAELITLGDQIKSLGGDGVD